MDRPTRSMQADRSEEKGRCSSRPCFVCCCPSASEAGGALHPTIARPAKGGTRSEQQRQRRLCSWIAATLAVASSSLCPVVLPDRRCC